MTQQKTPPPYRQQLDAANYVGAELRPYDGRPNCNDALDHPSRAGKYRYFRDGTVTVEETE